jgi:N-acyl-D-aspartate/D-glutamate deacylase
MAGALFSNRRTIMIRYVWKNDDYVSLKNAKDADPQAIGEALKKIEDKEGRMPTEAIVTAAKNKEHVLHPHFEWNDKLAAHQHRLHQARHLVSLIRIDDGTDLPPPAYYSIADKEGYAYRPHDKVVRSYELQHAVLKQAERDLSAFLLRYRVLQDVCDLVKPAKDVLDRKLSEVHAPL